MTAYLDEVLKHLQGKHPQKAHAGGRGSGATGKGKGGKRPKRPVLDSSRRVGSQVNKVGTFLQRNKKRIPEATFDKLNMRGFNIAQNANPGNTKRDNPYRTTSGKIDKTRVFRDMNQLLQDIEDAAK